MQALYHNNIRVMFFYETMQPERKQSPHFGKMFKVVLYTIFLIITLVIYLFDANDLVFFCQCFQYPSIGLNAFNPCFRRIELFGEDITRKQKLHVKRIKLFQNVSMSANVNFIFSR